MAWKYALDAISTERCFNANVRFGSKADIGARPRDVRFTPKSGHWNSVSKCPLCAKSGHYALQQLCLPLLQELANFRQQREYMRKWRGRQRSKAV